MSATRLLVLGVVRRLGRAHGYLVRAELLSWGAEAWANVKWGSLYHALRQLEKEGLLSSTQIADWPGRVDYQITDRGEETFLELLRDAIRQPAHRPDMLAAGLALLPALPRGEAIALCKERLSALEVKREELMKTLEQAGVVGQSTHFRELSSLWVSGADTGIEWTRGLIERLEGGAYVMVGEADDAFGYPGSGAAPPSPDAG